MSENNKACPAELDEEFLKGELEAMMMEDRQIFAAETVNTPEINENTFGVLDNLTEDFKKLIENMENSSKKLEEDKPIKLTKDEFIEKLKKCQNFRAHMFAENRLFNSIKNSLDYDVLYKEYEDMKTEKIGILSQYVQDKYLYISEKVGERVRITFREYDYEIIGNHNFPMSDPGIVLPPDEKLLEKWKMSAQSGYYIFEEIDKNVLNPLTYIRVYSINKDIFLYNGEIIVHVQDSNVEYNSEKEEKLLADFVDYVNSMGGDRVEEILNRLIVENPGISEKN